MKHEIAIKRYSHLIGQRFGKLVITEVLGHVDGKHAVQVRCKCDCTREAIVGVSALLKGQRESCGECGYRSERIRKTKQVDMTGFRSGKLVALYPTGKTDGKSVIWHCRCDCTNEVDVPQGYLRSGDKKSCGKCGYHKEQLVAAIGKYSGDIEHKIVKVYSAMQQRCYNPNDQRYDQYGARGIYICDEWRSNIRSFVDWALNNGYMEGLSIDRINNDGPYAPWNCRWTTDYEQTRNKSTNVWLTVNGRRMIVTDWARELGYTPNVIAAYYRAHGESKTIAHIQDILSRKSNNV